MRDDKIQENIKMQTAKSVSLEELTPSKSGDQMFNGNFSLISGLKVKVEVFVGSAELTVQELFALQKGSVVSLRELHNTPLEVRLDGKPFAYGSLVVVDENFGIHVEEIISAAAIE